jgi:hypothetical protein
MAGVIHADVEAVVVGHLRTALAARSEPFAANVTVRNRVPDETASQPWPTSKRLVVVRDDGGPSLGDVRAVARLGVRVWGADEAEASDLANLVSALVASMENVGPVRRSDSARPYEVTEQSGRPCFYFTSELVVRGSSL